MAQAFQLASPAPFDPTGDPTSVAQRWKRWRTSFEYFITASGIVDDTQKRACLLHVLGSTTQEIFETFPNTGSDFKSALDQLDEHFKISENVTYELHTFYQAYQN